MPIFSSASFPNVLLSPLVKGVLIDGPMYNISNYDPTPSLASAFECHLGELHDTSYVYDIYWYINGNNVKVIKNIPHDDINGFMKDSDWKGLYYMNMDVSILLLIFMLQLLSTG